MLGTIEPKSEEGNGLLLSQPSSSHVKRGEHVVKTPTSISFNNLMYTAKLKNGQKLEVLKNLTGGVKSGEVLIVVGPSGCGKTSFLDLLARRIGAGMHYTGDVLFNGEKLSTAKRRKALSYVANENSLMGVLSVRETLWFAARFYYGYYSKSNEEIKNQIEALIDTMGLRICANTKVGNLFMKGLSGGQKKRLAIATELISSPPIILMDEPTSGLDSSGAFAIMKQLFHLGELGHTIIATVHQPGSELFALMQHDLMVMARGECVYLGEAKKCVEYFSSLGYHCPDTFNPTDFVVNLVTSDFDLALFDKPKSYQELVKHYAASEMATRNEARANFNKKSLAKNQSTTVLDALEEKEREVMPICSRLVHRFSIFRALTHRNLLNVARNPGIIYVRLVMYTGLSVLIGLVYLNQGKKTDQAGVIARTTACLWFGFLVFNSVAVLPFLIEERPIFLREKRNGAYTALEYSLAAFVAIFPGMLLISICYSLIVFFMINLNNFGYFFAVVFLSVCYGETFQLFMASFMPNYILGIAAGSSFFGLSLTVMGFFIVFYQIPWYIRWIGYILPYTYSFRAAMRNEWQGVTNLTDPAFSSGDEIIEFYFGTTYINSVGGDLGIIFLFGLSYLFLCWVCLEFYWR